VAVVEIDSARFCVRGGTRLIAGERERRSTNRDLTDSGENRCQRPQSDRPPRKRPIERHLDLKYPRLAERVVYRAGS